MDLPEGFEKRVREELIPEIASSDVFACTMPQNLENVNIKLAVELGLAVLFDKPIISVIQPGTKIPEKLAKITDKFVELNMADPKGDAKRIGDAIMEIPLKEKK
jgi:hypothetical protein